MLKTKPHQLVANGICLAILATYAVIGLKYPLAYIWATYEDLFGEWIQYWAFVVALILSIRVVFLRRRFKIFFTLLAIACFYVAMEEISWGQRLLGFESPEFFRENNLQGETNLHNFLTGPYSTQLKRTVTLVLAACIAAYGVIYPALLRLGWRPAKWIQARGIASPPLYAALFFLGGAILELGPFGFNEAEVAEILVGLGLATTAAHYSFAQRRGHEPANMRDWPTEAYRGLATYVGLLFATVLTLSVVTTASVYSSENGKTRIVKRINAGVEKFAGRYKRVKHWDVAINLYERVLQQKPKSTSTMRKLAACYNGAGDADRHDEYVEAAIAIDKRRFQADPKSTSVRRSLVRSYRMLGQHDKADKLLREALKLGLKRVRKHPDSPPAAYSLGQTYTLMEKHAAALEQYARAKELKPTSKKYRKAYYSALKKVE